MKQKYAEGCMFLRRETKCLLALTLSSRICTGVKFRNMQHCFIQVVGPNQFQSMKTPRGYNKNKKLD